MNDPYDPYDPPGPPDRPDQQDESLPDPSGAPSNEPSGDPAWCLIVEDDVEIAGLISLLVSRISGLPVEICYTGTDAIEKLGQRGRPFVAICDIMLPGADGIEVATTLRTMPDGHRTRLIFLSAVDPERIDSELAPLDPYSYMRKPVRLANLQEVILGAFDAAERSMEINHDFSEELSEYMDSIDRSADISWD